MHRQPLPQRARYRPLQGGHRHHVVPRVPHLALQQLPERRGTRVRRLRSREHPRGLLRQQHRGAAALLRALADLPSRKGIDETASLLRTRIVAHCKATERNIRVDSSRFKPVDITRLRA